MPTNNQILLSEIVTRNFADNPQYSTEDSYFEFFSAQQVLKKYDLSDEEIEQHLTGSGSDGGCDGIFFFADGELLLSAGHGHYGLFRLGADWPGSLHEPPRRMRLHGGAGGTGWYGDRSAPDLGK